MGENDLPVVAVTIDTRGERPSEWGGGLGAVEHAFK